MVCPVQSLDLHMLCTCMYNSMIVHGANCMCIFCQGMWQVLFNNKELKHHIIDQVVFDEFICWNFVDKRKNGSKVKTQSRGAYITAYLSGLKSMEGTHALQVLGEVPVVLQVWSTPCLGTILSVQYAYGTLLS